MGIRSEDDNVISAREFVAWYNGLPNCHDSYKIIENKLRNSETITLIGQGNVAIDVARILISPIDSLAKTDITDRALSTLSECNVQNIHLVGRRGPLQAAFTIKELREILNMPNVSTIWRTDDFKGINDQTISKLPRPKKRIIDLMLKHVNAQTNSFEKKKRFMPIFFRIPKSIENLGSNGMKLDLTVSQLSDSERAIPTNDIETLMTNVVLRSIGYKGVNVVNDELLNFDTLKGIIRNNQGRVLKPIQSSDNKEIHYEHGLYVSGWLGTGPIGVILTTMNNSFLVAKNICHDIQTENIDCTLKPGIDITKYPTAITWQDWIKIDKYEMECGTLKGKPREKVLQTSKMLELVK